MSTARTYIEATQLNNKIYAIGGSDSTGAVVPTVEEFDIFSNTWTTRASMNNPKFYHSVATINGKIYSTGGRLVTNGELSKITEEYTPLFAGVNNLIANAIGNSITLNWTAVSGATSYNVKRATTTGGPYTTIATSVTGTIYTDIAVTNGTTYYYIVTAVNAGGESGNSNEASATTNALTRYVLNITMTNGLEQEFDLSKAEFDSYVNWYDSRANGTGLAKYTFDSPLQKDLPHCAK